jgi:hypothetical protein
MGEAMRLSWALAIAIYIVLLAVPVLLSIFAAPSVFAR